MVDNVEVKAEQQDVTPTGQSQDDKQSFTQSELDSLLDKHAAKDLETAREKWEAEKQEEISKAEQLAKMSAAERKEAEDKAKLEALNKREQELNMREYRYEAKHQLEEVGLPDTMVDMVLSDNAETTKNNITALKELVDKHVEATVNERLKGSEPKAGGTTVVKDHLDEILSQYKK